MTNYTGLWVHPNELKEEIKVGDYVMIETLDSVIVEEVYQIKNGQLYYFNGCLGEIPHEQILAVKLK